MPLNVVNIVAGIITTGVIVDYGIGITYEYRHNLHFGTIMAMTLSAVSNVIGVGGAAVCVASGALFHRRCHGHVAWSSGYLSSVIVIPSLCSMPGDTKHGG